MHVKVDEKTQEYIRQARQARSEIITEADLTPLPEPVQRYLRYAQVLGKPRVKCVKVRQKGLLRTSPTQKWMPVEAVQYTTLAGPLSRIWLCQDQDGAVHTSHQVTIDYDNGTRSYMQIKLLSMFSVVDVRGPEVDMSALIIFINDMVMWPTAFLSDYIHWEPLDAMAAMRGSPCTASSSRRYSASMTSVNWPTLSPRTGIARLARAPANQVVNAFAAISSRSTNCVFLPKVMPSGTCRKVSFPTSKLQSARSDTIRLTMTNSHHAMDRIDEQCKEVTMKILTIMASFVLIMHGLIHLMGTTVYLKLAEIKGMLYKTTVLDGRWDLGANGIAIYGALWALAAVGFIVSAIAILVGWNWWQPVLIGVTLFSLALIALDRRVAYAGVIINIVILAVIWVGPRITNWFLR